MILKQGRTPKPQPRQIFNQYLVPLSKGEYASSTHATWLGSKRQTPPFKLTVQNPSPRICHPYMKAFNYFLISMNVLSHLYCNFFLIIYWKFHLLHIFAGSWVHCGYHLTTSIVAPALLSLPFALAFLGWVSGVLCLIIEALV